MYYQCIFIIDKENIIYLYLSLTNHHSNELYIFATVSSSVSLWLQIKASLHRSCCKIIIFKNYSMQSYSMLRSLLFCCSVKFFLDYYITHVQNWVHHRIRKMSIVIQRNIHSSLQDYLIGRVLTIIQIKHQVQVRFLKCFYQGKLSSHARESSWLFFSILNDDKCISAEKQWIIKIRPLIKTIKDQICYLIYPTSRLQNIND